MEKIDEKGPRDLNNKDLIEGLYGCNLNFFCKHSTYKKTMFNFTLALINILGHWN